MLSIIIPLYNKAPYIRKCLESVFAQTFTNFEIIVVDDGSTDHSLENLRATIYDLQLSEEKIKIITQQNQGVSTARNNGVKLAKYDYITFLDADDWWEPTYLEEMKAFIIRHPEAGIYGCSYFKVQNSQLIPASIGVGDDFQEGIINYCRVYSKTFYMPLTSITTVVRKSVFIEENGFKTNLILGEDFDLWIRIALKYPVAFLNKRLAYYNQDVSTEYRAVVKQRIYSPDSIYIFNLDYLSDAENRNADLKYLLDLLRVYTLERYRLQGAYKDLVRKEIVKVDFRSQKKWFWILYHFPVWTIKLYYLMGKNVKKVLRSIKTL